MNIKQARRLNNTHSAVKSVYLIKEIIGLHNLHKNQLEHKTFTKILCVVTGNKHVQLSSI